MFAYRPARRLGALRTRLGVEPLEERWNPTTFEVSNVNDAGDGSLRAAVEAATGNDSHTIVFVGAAATAASITLQSEIVINGNVTITGPLEGRDVVLSIRGRVNGVGDTLSGNRVFTIASGKAVRLDNLELKTGAAFGADPNGGVVKVNSGATLYGQNYFIEEGAAQGDGGGVWVGSGATFTMRRGAILKNGAAHNGGGVAFDSGLKFELFDSLVEENKAGENGGGLWIKKFDNSNQFLGQMEGVSISRNIAQYEGGGVHLRWGTPGVPTRDFEITTTSVDSNDAMGGYGGGIYARGYIKITGGSASNNTARYQGQGQPARADGVGIHVAGGTVVIRDVRATGNEVAPVDPPPGGGEADEPDDPSAVYVAPGAQAIFCETTTLEEANVAGLDTLWNAGLVDISETGDPREFATTTLVGSYTQAGTGTLAIDLTNGDGDVLQVTGAGNLVQLAGGLDLHAHWTTPPAYGTVYTIIKNDTDQYTSGYFAGLPDGTEFWLEGAKFRINYGVYMGDFNDVILTVVTTGTVSGTVWWDEDADGIHDPEETNTSFGWVALFDLYGNMVACTSVNTDGSYAFTDVIPGQYVLYASQASFVPSPQDQGDDDDYDSDVNAYGYSDPFTLLGGQVVDLDVGMVYFV